MENTENNEVDALCPECGYSFKAYVDRLLSEAEINRSDKKDVSCPVCGCTECKIGRQINCGSLVGTDMISEIERQHQP